MRRLIICTSLLLILSPAVSAGPFPETVSSAPKSTGTARFISFTATLVPGIVGGALIDGGDNQDSDDLKTAGLNISALGSYFGPGAGHRYAGNNGRFMSGAGTRLLIGLAGGVVLVSMGYEGETEDMESSERVILFATGAAVFTHGMYDVVNVDKSVDAYNERVSKPTMFASPCFLPTNGTLGVQLSWRS
ncbi:hypothetical protein GF420_15950 [candidate division GN15 bacterium]|nr:hypothetical protein [candidate division GN15 bacterium]